MTYSFILVGGREITASKDEIDFFVTTQLSNNFYWRHNKMLSQDLVKGFFNKQIKDKTLLRKISYYILFYAENLCFTAYLYTKVVDGKTKAKEYMKRHEKLLKELRELHKLNNKTEDINKLYGQIHKMIFKCLAYAIDPF